MKKNLKMTVLALLVLSAVSCTTFKFEGAQINREVPKYTSVGKFDTSIKVNEFLGTPGGVNVFNVTSDAMNSAVYEAVQREIMKASGDAAIDVSIEYKAEFLDMIFSGITSGIYCPATAYIKGTVVKYSK